MRVRYSWEVPVLGSAGGPRRALPLLGASTFLIVNGDTLTDVDVARAGRRASAQSGALVTMAVVPNTEAGQVRRRRASTHDGVVTGFVKRGSTEPSYHFIGVQVAEAEAFARVAGGRAVRVGRRALPGADRGAARARCALHVCDAEFFDIGTPADYLRHVAAARRAARARRRCTARGARGRPDRARRATRSCGTMWRSGEGRCCESASSPTASASRRTRRGSASRSARRRRAGAGRAPHRRSGDRVDLTSRSSMTERTERRRRTEPTRARASTSSSTTAACAARTPRSCR